MKSIFGRVKNWFSKPKKHPRTAKREIPNEPLSDFSPRVRS
jgi:hypothetical protein